MSLMFIGGSNAHHIKDAFGEPEDEFTLDTPFGCSHFIRKYIYDDYDFFFLFRHGISGYNITAPFVNYRANIFAAKKLGVTRILSWTGPGGINPKFEIGNLVVVSDIIDFTKKRDYTFFENGRLGFIRVSPPFCPVIRVQLVELLKGFNHPFHKKGVYICTEGPRLETPAEIRFFSKIGAEMVGMTLSPEAFLARELEICYGSICYITNYAEREDIEYKEGELFEGTLPEEKKHKVDRALLVIIELLKGFLKTKDDNNCLCKKSMLRYKKMGKIDDNFEDWIR